MDERVRTALLEIGLKLEFIELEIWEENLTNDEIVRRVIELGKYLRLTNIFNADGVGLTPVVLKHLGRSVDFKGLLGELDFLRNETRNGRFDVSNELQRDLEFTKFAWKHRERRGSIDSPREVYAEFTKLKELHPPQKIEKMVLSERHLKETKRAAFEAVGLLKFLLNYRQRVDGPIIVVGNDKAQYWGGGYGRMFVVEPLEEYLIEDFSVIYQSVTSHATMRLNVPSVFDKSVVKDLCEKMPHIVVVDGAGAPKTKHKTRFSRAIRGYANWFTVFNDLRAGGNEEIQSVTSLFPSNHLAELRKWDDYVLLKEQMSRWVAPGDPYKMTLWAPERGDKILMADLEVEWKEIGLDVKGPHVVFANPIIYRSDTGDRDRNIGPLNDVLGNVYSGTRPYYFDSSDKEIKEKIAIGLGPYGVETRVEGPTTASFIEEIQEQIKADIRDILRETHGDS